MKYREIKDIVCAENRSTVYYSMRCVWWTTTSKDLGELPNADLCCPYCASPLFKVPASDFLKLAESNPEHYGAGGLEAFASAHHGSGLHSADGWGSLVPAAICFPRKPRVLSTEKSIRCTRCGSEFSEAETEGMKGCLKCGATGVPCAIKDDVTIKINWHELRILGMWADNWAGVCDEREPEKDGKGAVTGILSRIQAQHPERAPLTLLGELKQMQETYPEMEATDGHGNVILPPKKPN